MDERQALIEAIGGQLRAKVMSRFQTTTFLAGLTVAGLAAQLSNLSSSGRPPLFAVSIALMLGAVLLYVAGFVKLDQLTLPKRFWKGGPSDHTHDYAFVLLNDQDLAQLRNRMDFYWNNLTLAATGTAGLALLVLLAPETWITTLPRFTPAGRFLTALLALALVVAYLVLLSAVARKRFGAARLSR